MIEALAPDIESDVEQYFNTSHRSVKVEANYYNLVREFVDVMVDTQVELGFYKVERQAV